VWDFSKKISVFYQLTLILTTFLKMPPNPEKSFLGKKKFKIFHEYPIDY
jgi:hypothetical protein